MPPWLKAKIGDEVPVFVSDPEAALRALECGLGVLIAELSGFLVVRLGGAFILGSAAPRLRKCTHLHHGPDMTLRGGLFKQCARRGIVLRAADTLRGHQSELILRFRGICFRRFREQGSGFDGIIGRRAAGVGLGECREIGGTARVAGLGGALEQFARLRIVLGEARPGRKHDAQFDHGRGAALVGGLAIGANRFRHLLVGHVGAPELVKRAT